MEGLWLVTFGLGLIIMQFSVHLAYHIKSTVQPRLDVEKVAVFVGLLSFTIASIVYALTLHL